VIFLFTFSILNGQVDSTSHQKSASEVHSTSINWKPFTIKLNTSVYGYGLALEKNNSRKLFMRTSFTSDFKKYPNDEFA